MDYSVMIVAFALTLTIARGEYLYAGFAYLDNVYFHNDKVYKTLSLSSECKCREICVKEEKCLNYLWYSTTSDYIMCLLSDVPYEKLDLTRKSGKHVGLKLEQFKFVGSDDKTYYKHFLTKGYEETKKVCEAVRPSFRIGVYKTMKELDVINNVFGEENVGIWTSLVAIVGKDGNRDNGQWPDGTLFNETEIGTNDKVSIHASANDAIYRLKEKNVFDDMSDLNKQYVVLCQSH